MSGGWEGSIALCDEVLKEIKHSTQIRMFNAATNMCIILHQNVAEQISL